MNSFGVIYLLFATFRSESGVGCSYFFTKSEADVLINSVLRQNTACSDWSLLGSGPEGDEVL